MAGVVRDLFGEGGEMRKPRFRVGERVVALDGERTIDRTHFDPSDGWEYHFEGERPIFFHFEEDLRRLTRREIGASGGKKRAG